MASQPSSPNNNADPVVRSIPLHLAPSLPASYQPLVFQYPLRPPTRAYEHADVTHMQHKPVCGLVETTLNETSAFDTRHVNARARTSSLATSTHTTRSLAAMWADDGRSLVLVPVEAGVQILPAVTNPQYNSQQQSQPDDENHDDDDDDDDPSGAGGGAAGAAAAPSSVLKEDSSNLIRITTSVRTRETERQAELRQQSHAHLRRREEEERWRPAQPVVASAASLVASALSAPSELLKLSPTGVLASLGPPPSAPNHPPSGASGKQPNGTGQALKSEHTTTTSNDDDSNVDDDSNDDDHVDDDDMDDSSDDARLPLS